MSAAHEPVVRTAGPDDVARICGFGEANERAGAFYEREGFVVDRVEPSSSGEPALDVVWRVRPVSAMGHQE